MPARKRNRGVRAASAASTPTNVQDSDSAMPDADDEHSVKATPSLKSPVNSSAAPSLASGKKPHKEPINDEWTDEQDTSLFKGLIHWKPVGMHRHFRMIALSKYLRNHGYDPEVETHTRTAGIWAHLDKYFDLETLGQREDHIDDDPSDPQYIEFALPEDYDELKWKHGNVEFSKKRKSQKGKQSLRSEGGDQNTEDVIESKEVEEEDWNSSPAQFNPSATPPPTRKRKRGDTITRTRGSTVDDTDDARSSVNSPAATALPTVSSTRSARSNKRAAKVASSSRQASKDITVDEESSRAGDDDNGGEHDETDDTASIKTTTTRSNAKTAKGGTQVTTRKSARKR